MVTLTRAVSAVGDGGEEGAGRMIQRVYRILAELGHFTTTMTRVQFAMKAAQRVDKTLEIFGIFKKECN